MNIRIAFSVSRTPFKRRNREKNTIPDCRKRGLSEVKIYRDRKSEGMYYHVVYYTKTSVDGKEVSKRHRLNFSDPQEATNEAEAKASWLSRLDGDALQFSGCDRHIYARALDAVKEFDVPLDTVAGEYADARKGS